MGREKGGKKLEYKERRSGSWKGRKKRSAKRVQFQSENEFKIKRERLKKAKIVQSALSLICLRRNASDVKAYYESDTTKS